MGTIARSASVAADTATGRPATADEGRADVDAGETRSPGLMRAVNADVRQRLDGDSTGRVPFFCECGTVGCYRPLWLTPREYDVLSAEGTYAEAPGHVRPPDQAHPLALAPTAFDRTTPA